MMLEGEAYSRRLENLSDTTTELTLSLMGYTKEIAIKMIDLTADDSLTEEQLVEELLKLKEQAERQKAK